jgi:tetratricopeptide (TPR) repeat protein
MADVAWSERLVEVIVDLGPAGYRYGSGCVVAGKTVLTAAHVIAGALAVTVRDARKRSYPVEVEAEFVGDPGGPGPDLALVQVDALPGDGYPPLGLGRVVRDSPVPVVIERCHAFGFPGFAESSASVPSRDSVQAIGVIAALSKLTRGLLSMVVSIEPEALNSERTPAGESPWSGMSGGPVVAEGRLVGVVVEHSLAEGSSAITVVPLTALEANPVQPRWGAGVPDPAAWWRRLAVAGPADLYPLPTPPPTPEIVEERTSAYVAQVSRIAPAELLGRAKELDELAEFCTAPGRGSYLWLRASAWAGKSALVSWFVLHPPPGVRVVSFFVTARFASQDDHVAFADAVLEQTLALLGRPVPALLTESTRDAHLLTQLNEAAALCRARAERLVLVVDGLDEDRGIDGHSIAALLPARPIAGMRVIVTGRPNPPLPADVREDHPLHDPATVRMLAESPHAALTRASTERELKRLLTDPSGDRDLLGLITAAGGGLTARDLAELTNRQAWQVEDRLRATAGRTFGTRAGTWQHQEAYVLGHEELQKHAIRLLGSDALEAYRERLQQWADAYQRRGWPDNTPDFLLQGYFRLMQATGQLAQMVDLVTDPDRQARMLARSGAESAAAAELTMTQDAILARDPPDLAAMAPVVVHRDVLIQRNRNISAELPALWARLGAYTRAEALAQSINDPEQRAEAFRLIANVVAPTGPDDDPKPQDPSPPTASDVVELATEDPDSLVKHAVETLINVARSISGAVEAVTLFDLAGATAYRASDPDLRADLWNEVTWGRASAAPSHDAQTRPDTALAITEDPQFAVLDGVIEHALAIGDLDRAAAIALAAHRAHLRSRLLATVIEHAVRTGDLGRAEQFALSLPSGDSRTEALNRLVEVAVETSPPNSVEHIARALVAIEGGPTGLILVAEATWDRGDAERARALLAEALDALKEPFSSHAEDAFIDGVRIMAKMGDVSDAASKAAACANNEVRTRALVTVAQAASDRGDKVHARTLADQALQNATRKTPGWFWLRWRDSLSDAAGLLARLGEVERAGSIAQGITDLEVRTDILVRIVEAALDAGDLAAAGATRDLIVNPSARAKLLPQFVRAHLQAGEYAAAMFAAQQVPGADVRTDLVTEVVRHAIDDGALETAQAFLEAAEIAARSAPDPAWRADALTAAAWALVPGGDIGKIGMLTVAAEAAAHLIPDVESRAAALVDLAAVVVAVGDPERAEGIFEGAAHATSILCNWAEHLAARACATADRGQHQTAWAQVSAVGSLARWIAEPHNRVRALQARLAAAIHIGDFDQAEDAAHAIEHPDQHALALVDVARALAANGQAERAIAVAVAIPNPDRQADALTEVARLVAAQLEFDLAEHAARAITVRGGRSPALLAVAWEATRTGDLTRAERIVASITDPEWRNLGTHVIQAQRDAPTAVQTQTDNAPAEHPARNRQRPPDQEQRVEDLLNRVDATPDDPSAATLLAEAMRAGPCAPTLASLSRVDPSAAAAAAAALLKLLG